MEQLVQMKSNMRTQVVLTKCINTNNSGIFVENIFVCEINQGPSAYMKTPRLCLSAKPAQSGSTEQSW